MTTGDGSQYLLVADQLTSNNVVTLEWDMFAALYNLLLC